MTSLSSRISLRALLRLFALLLAAVLVVVPAAEAKKKTKTKTKKVQLVGKTVGLSKAKLIVQSKGKKFAVNIAPTTQLKGDDSNEDGALDVEDISKGDNVKVSGTAKGRQVTAKLVANLSDPVEGDDDGDGASDDLETEDVNAVVDSVNLEQEVISVTVLGGDFDGQQLIIEAGAGTVLVTGDRNRDKNRALDDVAVGDQLKLILLAPVNPDNPQALVIIDKTSLGQAKRQNRKRGGLPVVGAVQSVDPSSGQVVIVPSVDGVDLPAVTFTTNETTKFEIADSNGDSARDINDIAVGSDLKAILRGVEGGLVAIKVEDETWEESEGRPDNFEDENEEIKGIVAAVDLAGKTITVAHPRSGATRQIKFDEETDLRTPDTNRDGRRDAADIVIGAKVEGLIDKDDRAIILAVHVEDDHSDDQGDDNDQPSGNPQPPQPPFPSPLVWKGEIEAKTVDSLSLRIDGGPLEGQLLTAVLTPQTLYIDKETKQPINPAAIVVGSEAVVTINNPDEKKAIVVFVDND